MRRPHVREDPRLTKHPALDQRGGAAAVRRHRRLRRT